MQRAADCVVWFGRRFGLEARNGGCWRRAPIAPAARLPVDDEADVYARPLARGLAAETAGPLNRIIDGVDPGDGVCAATRRRQAGSDDVPLEVGPKGLRPVLVLRRLIVAAPPASRSGATNDLRQAATECGSVGAGGS